MASSRVVPVVLVAVLLVTAVVLGACGGSGGDETATSSVSTIAVTLAPARSTTTLAARVTFDTAIPTIPADRDCTASSFNADSSVSTVGLDAVVFGMTPASAEAATNSCLIADREVNRDCYYVRPAGGPDGVAFLVTAGTIERVDVFSGTITTRSGVGVGSTEQQVRELFGAQIEDRAHPAVAGGLELLFVPQDEADKQFRVIFEIEAGSVIGYRSGRLPQVDPTSTCPQ